MLLSSLSFAGYDLGNFRYYNLRVSSGDSYIVKDSVFMVDTWDGSGTRCSFLVDRAKYFTRNETVYGIDTNFVYFDGQYLVDILWGIPIKHLKFPIIAGDWWQAIDTCFYPLNTYYPFEDIDLDGIVDSMFVDTAIARVLRVSGDTVEILVGEIFKKVKTTRPRIISIDTSTNDTVKWAHMEHLEKFNLKLTYVAYLGYISLRVDTLYSADTWAVIHTSPYDSTQIPPVYLPMRDYYIKEYLSTNAKEISSGFKSDDVKIYNISGRLIKPDFLRTKKGVYFIKVKDRIKKVIVR